jgi:hypothetical protein
VKDLRGPDEARAEERGWRVVAAAFEERGPVARGRTLPWRPVAAAAVLGALVAVAFSPPGHAVITSVRKAIGIERAQRALYSLPARGRILTGGWLVHADGSTRHLGDYRASAWSPFGRFVVATKADELLALTPDGDVRWTLARRDVRFPRWTGTYDDTRIAYLSGDRLHVVAGDGSGDREAGTAAAAGVAPAWRRGGAPFVLAYADSRGRVWAFEPDTGRLLFRTHVLDRPRLLEWSPPGTRLLVVDARGVHVFDAQGRPTAIVHGSFVDAAFLPGNGRVVTLTRHSVELGGRTLFRTSGRLGQIVPSPNGRWLLVTWPEADQWLFVPVRGGRTRAVGNIAEQLGGSGFPVGGWTS